MTTIVIKLDDTFDLHTVDTKLRHTFDTHTNIIDVVLHRVLWYASQTQADSSRQASPAPTNDHLAVVTAISCSCDAYLAPKLRPEMLDLQILRKLSAKGRLRISINWKRGKWPNGCVKRRFLAKWMPPSQKAPYERWKWLKRVKYCTRGFSGGPQRFRRKGTWPLIEIIMPDSSPVWGGQ